MESTGVIMVWFSLVLLFLIILILLISYITYRIAFYASPRHRGEVLSLPQDANYSDSERDSLQALMQDMAQRPYETVSICSHDGLTLYGRYYHFFDHAPLELQFHGYRGSALRDYCAGNRLAREAGHNALVVDQRAHGKSEGRTITFGIKERLELFPDAPHGFSFMVDSNRYRQIIREFNQQYVDL